MAAWQCRFNIAPQKYVHEGEQINESNFAWKKEILPINLLKSIEKYLPIQKSWSKDITQFGDLQKTCVEVFNIGDDNFDISIRLDLPNLTKQMYELILNLILKSDCMICVVETQKVYSGNEESFKKVIKESLAYRLGKKYNSFVASL